MYMKVAIIDPLGAHGSSHHFYLFGQLDGLKRNNVNVSLYTNSKTENPHIDGVKFYQTYGDLFLSNNFFINGFRFFLGSFRSILHARISRVKAFHFHIFHINFLVLINLLLIKLLFGKLILTIHDVSSFAKSQTPSLISNFAYKLADVILTHNKYSHNEIIKLDSSLKPKIHTIPHGNYLPFINIIEDKNKSRGYLDLPEEKIIVMFFGMIKEVKGLDILLKSFKKVVDKNPNVVLLIAGKPWKTDFSFYQSIIEKNQLEDHVILHTKFISHNDVKYYYSASDLVVLPYKKIYQSGVLMMTLSYGKAALISDLPAITEVVTDNENAFLFKSEDVNDLAEKLNIILCNKQNLERVSKNGRVLMQKKFSWNEIGRLTKIAYQTL